jgi:precorrin-6A/cobalt-precorrin-6A reductase
MTRLLILGGTGEAAALAAAVTERFGEALQVTTSLAGRTERPGPIAGQVRIGGFGGAEGLAEYLRRERVDLLVDATHPFADEMSAHARRAADATDVPRLMLVRPPWPRHPLDRWIEVDDLVGAARVVARIGRRAFLTIGSGDVAAFAGIDTVRFLIRLVDRPRQALPLRYHEVIIGRGPFSLAEEKHLIERHAINVLVCKASGGEATAPKLVAAREASLPVVMVRRPPQEPGEKVTTVTAALDWIAAASQRRFRST